MKKVKKVDVYNDAEMVSLGIRKPGVQPRDPNVWTKSASEKEALKKARRMKTYFGPSVGPAKVIPVPGKLIVLIKPSPNFKTSRGFVQTTFSHKCIQSEIPLILSKYKDGGYSIVRNYKWNGKTYLPGELPFWGR